jgi:hypothetical protein
MSYLAAHLNTLEQGFNHTLARNVDTLTALGRTMAQAQAQGQGLIYQALLRQSSIMGYIDAFIYSGIASLLVIPFVFLLRPAVPRASRGAAA